MLLQLQINSFGIMVFFFCIRGCEIFMIANGVPHHAQYAFAPGGVYPATLSPAPLSAVLQIRALSPQLESAAPSVATMEGQIKVKRTGLCCEECAAAKGSCLYEGTVRYHGEMWNSTGCEFCTCNRGQVLCQRAECGRVECPEDMARWTDGGCRECECRDAQVTCYLRSCPTCPPGTLALAQEDRCCPECRHDSMSIIAVMPVSVVPDAYRVSSAMQTVWRVWELLTTVKAARTQRPFSTLATACLSVQLVTMQREEYVQLSTVPFRLPVLLVSPTLTACDRS
ncbi:Extracellular matrix protein FRAS1 Precursor [Channa argus]|uniref:Extracellular matrix protein FRAS1 n=1 Tax=Channa argus TaxID=215402 RepID=A0A6G1PYT9_CHAAH|nr:Extracellular matrix protein FRAS1 Precursor [Channa argus]